MNIVTCIVKFCEAGDVDEHCAVPCSVQLWILSYSIFIYIHFILHITYDVVVVVVFFFHFLLSAYFVLCACFDVDVDVEFENTRGRGESNVYSRSRAHKIIIINTRRSRQCTRMGLYMQSLLCFIDVCESAVLSWAMRAVCY